MNGISAVSWKMNVQETALAYCKTPKPPWLIKKYEKNSRFFVLIVFS